MNKKYVQARGAKQRFIVATDLPLPLPALVSAFEFGSRLYREAGGVVARDDNVAIAVGLAWLGRPIQALGVAVLEVVCEVSGDGILILQIAGAVAA